MQAGACIIFPSPSLRSAEQTGEERYESGTDQGDSAAGHELLHTLGLGAGIIVAISFQKVDGAPDTKACSELFPPFEFRITRVIETKLALHRSACAPMPQEKGMKKAGD